MVFAKRTAVLLVGLLLCATGCALYRNDRMWIPDARYEAARAVYDETGSLTLTEDKLRADPTWQRGEINEATYRLKKQYRLE
jgi:hypothetical protein